MKLSDLEKKLIEEILSFVALPQNWDGYGAIPLCVKCALNAIDLVCKIDKKVFNKEYDLSPMPYGTIVIEWSNNEDYVSLEIGTTTCGYIVKTKTLAYNEDFLINALEINDLVKHIIAL